MLTIILLAVIAAGLVWYGLKKDEATAFVFGCLFAIATAICLLTLINRGNRFDEEIENYANLKMQVDDYNMLPDSCKNISFEYDIRDDVLRMNNNISRHKVMSRSPWVNVWHSREIGNLEKLRVYGPAQHTTHKTEQQQKQTI